MQQTPTLIVLMSLQGKIIVHENRLYRIDIYKRKCKVIAPDVEPTFIQSFFGGKTTYKEVEQEDVDCIYLISCKTSKTHLCMSPSIFCKEVLNKPDADLLTMYYTRKKITEFFNLKGDFYTMYDMTPKEVKHKAENI